MLRNPIYAQCLMTDGGFSFDPTDTEVLENLVKKTIREGEEKFMLAVLTHAVDYFQKHVLARNDSGKKAVPRGGRMVSGDECRLAFLF